MLTGLWELSRGLCNRIISGMRWICLNGRIHLILAPLLCNRNFLSTFKKNHVHYFYNFKATLDYDGPWIVKRRSLRMYLNGICCFSIILEDYLCRISTLQVKSSLEITPNPDLMNNLSAREII